MKAILAAALVTLTALTARAENHALLIGIDEYQDRNNINPLGAAARDARDLAKALAEVSQFPQSNIHVLTSDGETKPTGANIVFELGQLAKAVKPGDVVFFAFSGHGVESEADEITYLLPYDADARSEATLARTGVSTAELFKQLKRLPAKAVVLAFDMCRSDPKKGARDVVATNRLGKRQAEKFRNLVLDAAQGAGTSETAGRPRLVVTLFACSPGQRSWEWTSKQRGYFSYFLEEGLRRGAADSAGEVRLPNLINYLEKAVSGAVQRELGQDQTPAKLEIGTGAQEVVLARSRPAGNGGETAVPAQVGSTAKDRYDAAFQRAIELHKQGRIDAAQLKFEEASELDPKAARPVHFLADIAFWNRKDLAESEKLYKRALDLEPKNGKLLGAYANYWFARQDLPKAVELYKQAIALAPDNARLHIGLATVSQFRSEFAEAEKHFEQARLLDPKDAESIAGLGYMRATQGKLAEAETLLKRAAVLDPKSFMPLMYLAETYAMGKKYADAERAYEQAIALEPTFAGLQMGIGLVLTRKGDHKAALARMQKAIDMDPKNGMFRANLASVLLYLGDRNEARREAQRAIDLGFRQKHPAFDSLGLKP